MKNEKALERSETKARGQEALIKKHYFEQKQNADSQSEKKEITFQDWSTKFLEIAALDYQDKPGTLAFFQDRVKALLRYKPLNLVLLSKIDAELIDAPKRLRRYCLEYRNAA